MPTCESHTFYAGFLTLCRLSLSDWEFSLLHASVHMPLARGPTGSDLGLESSALSSAECRRAPL